MFVRNPLLLPESQNLLVDPAGNYHSLIQQNSLKLVASTFSAKVYWQKKYQKGLQPLLQTPEEPAHLNITNLLGANVLADVMEGKYSHWM